MEKGGKGRFYKLRWMWNILRHGLFLRGLNNRLGRIGIDILLYYYWVSDVDADIVPPKIRGDDSGFSLSYLTEAEVVSAQKAIIGLGNKDYAAYLREGQKCLGLKHHDKIVSYTFIQRSTPYFKGEVFKLNANEAYTHSLYTFESYRGKNLATFLTYQCYRMCGDMGVDKVYSVTDYLNKSSSRLKNKLESKKVALYLSVQLFKGKRKTFLLKKYQITPQ